MAANFTVEISLPTTLESLLTTTSSSNSSNATSNSTQSVMEDLKLSDYLLLLAFTLIFLIGVSGNALVCYVFGFRQARRRSTTEWLILYLGIVDLMASFFNPPLYMYWTYTKHSTWHFGYLGCKVLPVLGPVMTTASAGILLIIAVDRYMAIVSPFKGQFSFFTVTFASIANVVICVALYGHYIHAIDLHGTACVILDVSEYSYSIPNCTLIMLRLILFTVVFVFTNFKIFVALKKQHRSMAQRELKLKRHKESQKIMRVLLVMGVVFVVLVFPRELFYLCYNLSWIDGEDGIQFGPHLLAINSWMKVMHTANSCANVFIYAHMHKLYRAHVVRFLSCFRKGGIDSNSQDTAASAPLMNEYAMKSNGCQYTMTDMLVDTDGIVKPVNINGNANKNSYFFKRAQMWRTQQHKHFQPITVVTTA